MSRTSTLVMVTLISCAALLAIAGQFASHLWLVHIFKPLALLLIIGIGIANWIPQRQSYALWICAGLACSLAGDILLMWPEQYFVAGLGAFLFAHVAYLAAFTRDVRFPASWPVLGFYLLIGAGMYFPLSSRLPAELKVPVVFYAFAVATMAAQAMGRYLQLRTGAAKFAAVGGIFFMLSDGLLAVDRFWTRIPYGTIVVLVPYYLAQVLIVLSTQHGEETGRLAN